MNIEVWKRNCPKCGVDIFYCDKYKLYIANQYNTKCKICWRQGRKNTTKSIYNKKCPECNVEMFYSSKYILQRSVKNNILCFSCGKTGNKSPVKGRIQTYEEKEKRAVKLRGQKRSVESKKRCSISKLGTNNPHYGKHIPKSEEHKRKIRLSCIKVIQERLSSVGKTMRPSFNINACKIIEDYGKQNGYNFQHALNGGEYCIKELGYWLDGYDKEKNVVIEFYENNHWHRKNKNRDLNRQKEIVDFLGCRFIILQQQIGGSYLPEYILR